MPNEPASLDILGVASATGGFDGLDRFSGIVFLGNALDKFLIAFTTLSEHVTEIQEFCPEHFDLRVRRSRRHRLATIVKHPSDDDENVDSLVNAGRILSSLGSVGPGIVLFQNPSHRLCITPYLLSYLLYLDITTIAFEFHNGLTQEPSDI